MKKYSVLCLGEPLDFANLFSVEVNAENPEEAKKQAVEFMKRTGHPNGMVAPDFGNPLMPVVEEISSPPPMKRYRVRCFLTRTEGEGLSSLKITASDEAAAKRIALDFLRKKGYPNALIPDDIPGLPIKIVEEINE